MNITKNALLIAHVVAIISILMLANCYNDRTFSTVFALGASVATFALFWWLWAVSLYPAFFSPLRNLPTAGGASIFFGHTLRIISEPSGMPMREWVDTISNDGLIRYIFAHKEHVLLTDGGAMGEVLTRSSSIFQKPLYLRRGLGRIVGSGVLLAEGDEHREQRKALLPAFSHRTIRELYPIFLSKAKELVDCLTTSSQLQYTGSEIPTMGGQHYQHSEGQPAKAIELGGWCSRVTLDIIGIAGFGQDFGALRDPTNELYQIYSRLVQPGFIGKIFRMIEVFLPLSFLRKIPVKWNRDLDNATDTIRTSCRRIIDTKREQPHGEAPVIRNILGVAMGSTTFSDENLVDQMMTFLAAGHETTARALKWGIYTLCRYPDIQHRLRLHIRNAMPSLNHDITVSEIQECHYLQAVCMEVLRVWPPISTIHRVASCDTQINRHYIPKGTMIVLCPWAINTSRTLWGDDAAEFNPERWLTNEGKINSKGGCLDHNGFLTFLHGPRSCIGQKFAQAELACLLAIWVSSFETRLENDQPLKLKGGVSANPSGGIWVFLKRLDIYERELVA